MFVGQGHRSKFKVKTVIRYSDAWLWVFSGCALRVEVWTVRESENFIATKQYAQY